MRVSDADFTVGDLRRQVQIWPEDTKLTFGGGLTFHRRWTELADAKGVCWSD